MGMPTDRDLTLLHRFEQSALHLGRRAVDFVGEHQIREDRTMMRPKFAGLRLEDHRAHDVAGQQIRGELDALELDAQGDADRFDEQGFGEAGHALQQHVAIGEQRYEQALDNGILADHGLADFLTKFLGPGWTVGHGKNRGD